VIAAAAVQLCSMNCQKITEGIIIGAVGGTAAGLAVSFIRYSHRKTVECIEKRRVYSWLRKNTKDENGGAISKHSRDCKLE
jgi:hypothetical protein